MFRDREEAGEQLAFKLRPLIKSKDYAVVPLLRGGIVLGKKIADHFNLPLRPISVKKIGAPSNSELAIGAVAFDKTSYLNKDLVGELNVSSEYIEESLNEKAKDALELQKRIEEKTEKINWEGKNIILVDDGVATGATVICASIYFRKQNVKKLILATPVISKDILGNIKQYFDIVVALNKVEALASVGQLYEYFPQVETEEALSLIKKSKVKSRV